MLRTLCTRQCLIASQVIRCHSTSVLKTHLSLTLLNESKFNNIQRFREIKRCFASTQTNLTSNESGQGKKVEVYKGILSTQIKLVKVFSLATSVTGVFMQPILYKQSSIIGGVPMVSDFKFTRLIYNVNEFADGHNDEHCWFLHVCDADFTAFGLQEIRDHSGLWCDEKWVQCRYVHFLHEKENCKMHVLAGF